jgi:hypothetical protein
LDRTAEERSENEGMTEHVQKALDPIAWEEGRIRRSNGGDYIVSTLPGEPDKFGRGAAVETTDLERRVLVLERILQALDSAQAAVRSVVGSGGFASLSGAVDRPQTSRGGF